ncbi:MAG: SurA N-terminal domain-containing protein [Methylococcales bacterium]|nr:SurA N-terminal domain-containing protein [Methylococcales bacterium]
MLTTIREKAQGVFAWIILIGITIPFALWGIQNYFDGGKEQSLLTVGDREFTANEISQAINQFRTSTPQAQALGEAQIKQRAIAKLIQDEALLQHVAQQKLAISDATARTFITSLPYFQVDGKFDKQRYEGLLKAQGLSSAAFVGRIKKALLMEQYQQALTNTGFVSDYELQQFYALQNQTRTFEYAVFNAPTDLSEPTPEQIQDYYQAHSADFFQPETLTASYVELNRSQLADSVQVEEAALQTLYEQQKAQFQQPERRKTSHILIALNEQRDDAQALALAKEIHGKLSATPFADLAKEYSDDPGSAKQGGDLGWLEPGLFVPEFEQAVLELSVGQVSEPVKTQFGYHLITVTALEEAKQKSFAEVKEELDRQYRQSQAENLYFQGYEKLTELSYEHPDSLATVAEQLALSIHTTEPFTREQGQGVAANAAFRKAAFSDLVMNGENSDPVESEEGLAWVVRKHSYQAAELKPLDEVRDQVIQALKSQQAQLQLTESVDQLKQQRLTGAALATLAEQANGQFHAEQSITRTNSTVSRTLLDALFTAAKPDDNKPNVFSVRLSDSQQALVAFTSVTPGNISDVTSDEIDKMRQALTQAKNQLQFSAALKQLSTDLKVEQSKKLNDL